LFYILHIVQSQNMLHGISFKRKFVTQWKKLLFFINNQLTYIKSFLSCCQDCQRGTKAIKMTMKWVLIYINTNLNIPVITTVCSPRSNQNDFPSVIVTIKQVQECTFSFNTQISHTLQKQVAFKKGSF